MLCRALVVYDKTVGHTIHISPKEQYFMCSSIFNASLLFYVASSGMVTLNYYFLTQKGQVTLNSYYHTTCFVRSVDTRSQTMKPFSSNFVWV